MPKRKYITAKRSNKIFQSSSYIKATNRGKLFRGGQRLR